MHYLNLLLRFADVLNSARFEIGRSRLVCSSRVVRRASCSMGYIYADKRSSLHVGSDASMARLTHGIISQFGARVSDCDCGCR